MSNVFIHINISDYTFFEKQEIIKETIIKDKSFDLYKENHLSIGQNTF